MGDIGTHAHNLARFITAEVTEVAAEVGAIVPGRLVHDYAGALLVRQRGPGVVLGHPSGGRSRERAADPGLRNRGSVEWHQEKPMRLLFTPLDRAGGVANPQWAGNTSLAARSTDRRRTSRSLPGGVRQHLPDAAEAIAARRSGTLPTRWPSTSPTPSTVPSVSVSSKRSYLEPGWRLLDRRHQVGTE